MKSYLLSLSYRSDDFVITESEDVTETEAAGGFIVSQITVYVVTILRYVTYVYPAPVLLEREEIQKMKIKQLKAMLEERGQECKGCLDKAR